MEARAQVETLIADGVPLTLLFDIAGYGPTSTQLLFEECQEAVLDRMLHLELPARSAVGAELPTAVGQIA